jgi:hypothetical protein
MDMVLSYRTMVLLGFARFLSAGLPVWRCSFPCLSKPHTSRLERPKHRRSQNASRRA